MSKLENADRLISKLQQISANDASEVCTQAVRQGGLLVQAQARLLITYVSGDLIRSVKVRNKSTSKGAEATVYTNSPYAAYYEFGTGPNGEANHNGISPNVNVHYKQQGWMIPGDAMTPDRAEGYGFKVVYKGDEPIGYLTKGQYARPFMYPAVHDNKDKINENAKKLLMKKLKERCI